MAAFERRVCRLRVGSGLSCWALTRNKALPVRRSCFVGGGGFGRQGSGALDARTLRQ